MFDFLVVKLGRNQRGLIVVDLLYELFTEKVVRFGELVRRNFDNSFKLPECCYGNYIYTWLALYYNVINCLFAADSVSSVKKC